MSNLSKALHVHLTIATALVVAMFGAVGAWAMTAHIAGAVIAQGRVVVEGEAKLVQHLTGGIIASITVAEGDWVEAGQVLATLVDTQVRADLTIVVNQLDELLLRRARLESEISGAEEIRFPAQILDRADEPDLANLIELEVRDFNVRLGARHGQKAQLEEQIQQIDVLILGLEQQRDAIERQAAIVSEELEAKRTLFARGLITAQQVNLLERELARLEGEIGTVVATIARAHSSTSETELKIIQVDHDLRTRAADELARVRNGIAELEERRRAAEDELMRMEIKAPQSGKVHELAVHTVGGVIGPGEVLMRIVPDPVGVTVETKINSAEIDQVAIGQRVKLRFTAFNQQTSPELEGVVSFVSADLSIDPDTEFGYFVIRISVTDDEVARLGQVILPGMPVETFIITHDRTVASFLIKPLSDQFQRAFRSE